MSLNLTNQPLCYFSGCRWRVWAAHWRDALQRSGWRWGGSEGKQGVSNRSGCKRQKVRKNAR